MGLNYNFIMKQGYTWIDNLITGSSKDLANPNHPNHNLPYLQEYLKNYGARKCEANAIVTTPRIARDLMRTEIENFLGNDSGNRFRAKTDRIKAEYDKILDISGLSPLINEFLDN